MRDVNGWPMCRCGPSVSARPTQAHRSIPGQDADVTVWDVRVQIGASPSRRIQAPQHVVAVGDVYGAEIEEIEREVLPVVGDCDILPRLTGSRSAWANGREVGDEALGFGSRQKLQQRVGIGVHSFSVQSHRPHKSGRPWRSSRHSGRSGCTARVRCRRIRHFRDRCAARATALPGLRGAVCRRRPARSPRAVGARFRSGRGDHHGPGTPPAQQSRGHRRCRTARRIRRHSHRHCCRPRRG